jgi:hypothetical protein
MSISKGTRRIVMAIRGYLAVEDRKLGVLCDPFERPYITFAGMSSVPNEDILSRVRYWTVKQSFSSRDGYKFASGKYELLLESGNAAVVLIDKKTLEDRVEYTVSGRFHTFLDLTTTIERLTYGKFPTVSVKFALGLLLAACKNSLKLYRRSHP